MYNGDFFLEKNEGQKDPFLNDPSVTGFDCLFATIDHSPDLALGGDRDESTTKELSANERLELAKSTAGEVMGRGDIGEEAFDHIARAVRAGQLNPDLLQ